MLDSHLLKISSSKPIGYNEMLRSTIRMHIPPEKQDEALNILASVCERAQFEAGCIKCRLYRGVEDAKVILLEELWMDLEDLQRHLRSEQYQEVLLVIEMASQPPEIRFDTIAQSRGIETIEQARTAPRG
jgi:quinol monooxygenase YgiN